MRRVLLAVTAAVGLAGAAAPPALAAPDRVCADELILEGTFQDVTVAPGTWCLFGHATVLGDFRAVGASSIGIFFQAQIAGNVTISGTTSYPDATGETFGGSANGICTSTIKGDLTVIDGGPHAPWNVGSTNYPPYANFSNCVGPNVVGGTVRYERNAADVNAIGGNTIGGDLICAGNGAFTPGFVAPGTPNQVAGTSRGQCAALGTHPETPAPAAAPATTPCTSRRRFEIRLDRRLRSARVRLASRPTARHARVVRGTRLRAVIDLRGLRAQRVLVTVTGRTRAGRTLRQHRAFRVCAGHAPR